MTVSDAISIFDEKNNVQNKILEFLKLMIRVGLEHLTLGQSTSTLSGGEAQRIKLVSELSKSGVASTLYLLDEPTTGLHSLEVEKLLAILKELVSKGHTVVVIEHNLDVIYCADTIIDFGPRGGIEGGRIIAKGTPQEVAENNDSLTGQCLKAYMAGQSVLTTVLGSSTSCSGESSRSSSPCSFFDKGTSDEVLLEAEQTKDSKMEC